MNEGGSMPAALYCECEAPVMDVEHDAGCRRCGRPVDFSPTEGGSMSAQGNEVERIERADRLAASMLKQGDSRPATEVWDAAYEVVAHRMMLEAAADAEVARDEWNAS